MSYCIYDSRGYIGDLCSNNGLNELVPFIQGSKILSMLYNKGYIEIDETILQTISSLPDSNTTVKNFKSLVKKCKDIAIITNGVFDEVNLKQVLNTLKGILEKAKEVLEDKLNGEK